MAHRLLYLDPWSGISGDMTLSALLDAGGPEVEPVLHQAVRSLGLPGVTVEVKHENEWGIACTRIAVHDEDAPPLRHLEDMIEVIGRAAVSDRVKEQACAAVTRLAEVEAGVHGSEIDHIHFHEVGAADTLVDIVGAFVLLEALAVDEVHVGTIPVGGGTVEIAHGRMGVPAPATAALLSGLQTIGGPEMRELTTPTGALLAVQLATKQGPLPAMTVKAVGYGAGTMKLQNGPNILRVVLGEVGDAPQRRTDGGSDTVVELQTNIDDVSPEVVGHAMRLLREAGALDVWAVPAQMKKDRPGLVLHVLTGPGMEGRMVDLLFAETGTLGVRRSEMQRHVAERGSVNVEVRGRQMAVKWGKWGEGMSLAPEYEDAARVAAAVQAPLRQIMQEATEAAGLILNGAGPA